MEIQKVLVIVPVKDEAGSLSGVLADLSREIGEMPQLSFQILVVDDGSNDQGAVVAAEQFGVRVFRQDQNLGKPRAVKAGFEIALAERYDAAIIFDGDGQHPASALPQMVRLLSESPIVKGSRFHPDSPDQGAPLDRRLLNAATRGVIQQFTGWEITDPQCGLIGLHASIVKELLPLLDWTEEWELEMIVRLWGGGRQDCPVLEFPIPAIYDGLSAKQVEKYAPDQISERLARIDRHMRVLYRLIQGYQ